MISFACRNVAIRDIITCSFDLKKTGYEVLLYLLKQQEGLTTQAIAKQMNLERSTVQKALRGLVEQGIVERRQLNLQSGGYQFIYSPIQKDEIRNRLRTVVDGWQKHVHEAITTW